MRSSIVLCFALLVTGCVTAPKLSISDSGFFTRDTVIAVVPFSDNMKAVLAADQLRNYLAANGAWKVVDKEYTERICFSKTFPITASNIDSGNIFTDNEASLEGAAAKLFDKEVRYLILVRPRSTTTTFRATTYRNGSGSASETMDVAIEATVISAPGKEISKYQSSGSATTFATGGFLLYLSDRNRAIITAIDKFVQTYAKQMLDLQRSAVR